jgi:5-methylcytosine-specific restriction enzyme subunit McrC
VRNGGTHGTILRRSQFRSIASRGWNLEGKGVSQESYLPGMLTDVSLRSKNQTVIIDAKYYKETLQEHYDKRSIHSKNLYQLFAYLKNLEQNGGIDRTAEGILLYPVVEDELDLVYEMHGHKMKVCTVNLMQDWKQIDFRLRSLIH